MNRAAPVHQTLGKAFFDIVAPARFPQHILRWRNDRAAGTVGLSGLDDAQWIAHFGRFAPLPDNLQQPLALRYHGHQFRQYNPDIGDGRGFLFAQLRAEDGRLLDLGTKGSGRTPYARTADGRLTLKGAVRELLATELLTARGVNTSQTFSIIETGEALQRHDEPSPTRSAVLVRLNHSHIRYGTFQRLAFEDNREALHRLVQHCLQHYVPESAHRSDAAPLALFDFTVRQAAKTCAQWMLAGFVHGVLNTDNMNITGESFDYGPWRFMGQFNPAFTAAYFDHAGLYCYGRQPEAVHWNLQQLANCLLLLETTGAPLRDGLETSLADYSEHLNLALARQTARRLHVDADDEAADALATALFQFLRTHSAGFERTLFDLQAGAVPDRLQASPQHALYASASGDALVAQLRALSPVSAPAAALNDLLIEQVEALWSSIEQHDDWAPLYKAIDQIRLQNPPSR